MALVVLDADRGDKAFGKQENRPRASLLVTGLNDSPDEIERLTDWIASLDRDIPLHFSRYFPNYKTDLPATPLEKLIEAREIARKKLSYVYIGNAQLPGASDTFCPNCGDEVISRIGYSRSTDCVISGFPLGPPSGYSSISTDITCWLQNCPSKVSTTR